MTLHLSKVAAGCRQLSELQARQRGRAENWQGQAAVPCLTRYRPRRHAALVGGSIFWIIRHTLVARQTILGFDDIVIRNGPYCRIMLGAGLVGVRPRAKRAHQGWRYLPAADAPPDLGQADADISALPPAMIRELTSLGLV